jgi:hypothetical protein
MLYTLHCGNEGKRFYLEKAVCDLMMVDDLGSPYRATCMSMLPAERRCGVGHKPRRHVGKPWDEALDSTWLIENLTTPKVPRINPTWRTKGDMHTSSTRTHWSVHGAIKRHSIYKSMWQQSVYAYSPDHKHATSKCCHHGRKSPAPPQDAQAILHGTP